VENRHTFILISVFFILFGTRYAKGQQKFNQFNPYVSNSNIFWLKKHDIDLSKKSIFQVDFQQAIQKSIRLHQAEKKLQSQFGLFCALSGVGIGASFSNSNSSFTSKSLNSIFGSIGLICGGIAIKKFIDRRNKRKKKELQLAISKSLFDKYF